MKDGSISRTNVLETIIVSDIKIIYISLTMVEFSIPKLPSN